MPLHVKDGGVWRQCIVHVKDGGVWRQVSMSARDGGVWRGVSEDISLNWASVNAAPGWTVSVTASGGTGGYTWTQTSGATATIESPSSASTRFWYGGEQTAWFKCTSGGGGVATIGVTWFVI